VAAVIWDEHTSRIYRGRNAQPYNAPLADWLQEGIALLPPGGIAKHGKPPLNCAECVAMQKALLDGAQPEHLHVYSFIFRGRLIEPIARCENCQVTFSDLILRIWSEPFWNQQP
jgi:hypothetical protein